MTVAWPQTVERKWKCHDCGAALTRKELVTKVKKAGKHYEIEGRGFALVCPEHGPVAWEA